MRFFQARQKIPKYLGKYLPIICIVIPTLAVVVLASFNRFDLALAGLYLFIGIFLAGIVGLVSPKLFISTEEESEEKTKRKILPFLNLSLIFFLLYILSVFLLVIFDSRPFYYFLLIAFMSGIIILEIQTNEVNRRSGTILIQIILLLLNLALGQTLKLPFYFGDTDLFGHMYYVNTIISSGHITPLMQDYQYFPLFHIINAEGAMLSGLDVKTSYFLISNLMFAVTVPVVFLIARNLTKNTAMSLIISLVYAMSREVIFYDMYTLTRSMADIFCVMILYLLISKENKSWYRTMAAFLIIPLIFTHQISLVIFTGILILIILISILLRTRVKTVSYTYVAMFTIAYLSYWIYIAIAFFSASFRGLIITQQTISLPVAGAIKLPWQNELAANMDYLLIGFLAILGVTGLLRLKNKYNNFLNIFVLFGLVSLVFFLPGIANYVLPLTVAYRIPIMVAPFVAIIAGAAIWFMLCQYKSRFLIKKLWAIAGAGLLVGYSFVTPILLGAQTDVNISQFTGLQNRKYFTQSEISSFTFISGHSGTTNGNTDVLSYYYLNDYSQLKQISCSVAALKVTANSYFLLRQAEYMTRKQLPFLDIQPGIRDRVENLTMNDDQGPLIAWSQENEVYNDNSVIIYYKY